MAQRGSVVGDPTEDRGEGLGQVADRGTGPEVDGGVDARTRFRPGEGGEDPVPEFHVAQPEDACCCWATLVATFLAAVSSSAEIRAS